MRVMFRFLAVTFAALALAGCLTREPQPTVTQAQGADDEAACRRLGEPGSKAFAECLKSRDGRGGNESARMDNAHRRNSEQMLLGR